MISLLGVVIFGYLTLFAWTSSARIYAASETVVWGEDNVLRNLLFAAAALAVCGGLGILAEKLSDRALHVTAVVVSILAVAVCRILAGAAHSYPDADQIYVYEAATNFYTNDYHNIQTEWYFNAYPYQLGVGLLFGALFKLVGNGDVLTLQYINGLFVGLMVYLCFKITLKLFGSKKAAMVCLVCQVLFLPMYLYAMFLYGETSGTCLMLAGILCMLYATDGKTRKKGWTVLFWVLAALFVTLGYIVRSALIIVWIAVFLIRLLGGLKKEKAYSLFAVLLMLITAVSAEKLAVEFMERQAGVRLAQGMPFMANLAEGIQDNDVNGTGPGSYNGYSLWLYCDKGFDNEETTKAAWYSVKQSLYRWSRDPAFMLEYMNQKVLNQWNEATYGRFMMTARQQDPAVWVQELYTGKTGDIWYAFLDLYQGLFYLMLLCYFAALFKGKEDTNRFLPGLLIIGEFFFSMLWEAKSRYVYPYIIMVMPCVAWSLSQSCEKLAVGAEVLRKRMRERRRWA